MHIPSYTRDSSRTNDRCRRRRTHSQVRTVADRSDSYGTVMEPSRQDSVTNAKESKKSASFIFEVF